METQNSLSNVPPKVAGLNNILNNDDQPPTNGHPPLHLRDSGFYSTAEMSSKHTSAASFNVNGLSPAGSGYQSSLADKTPSPIATNMVPQALVSPSASNMSVASMVSPTSSSNNDRRFDRPLSTDSQMYNGATLGEHLAAAGGPRRESVDSRINQGISDMRLGSSPYVSNNQSTSSIQNTLHSQRNPRSGLESLSVHRISNGYQPSAERNPVEPKVVKTAPAITGPATSHIARAAEPTKGQAWAFPEEEIQRVGPPGHYDDSRRSSVTESIASSQFTTESRLPPGQRRLEDGPEYAHMSSVSNEFPPVHHHTMQHKQLSDLQAEECNGPPGSQPYSRTPKVNSWTVWGCAENREEEEKKKMTDALTRVSNTAIAEHQRQTDHIRVLQTHYNTAASENEMLRRELQKMRMESAQLRGELSSTGHAQQGSPAPPPAAPAPALPPQNSQPTTYGNDAYVSTNRTELPPLRSIHNGPDSMTGVQYDAPRVNGYRQERY